jgi:streptogramin lyase
MSLRLRFLATASLAVLVALCSTLVGSPAIAGPPSWESITVDDTYLLPNTSAACGFDVYEHDFGTLKDQTIVLPDGSVKISDRAVHIDTVYFAPSTGKSVLVHPGGAGPFTVTLHPDGSVTLFARGTDGMITVPGVGLVFASSGNERVEISPTGEVTVIEHGNKSEDHSGLCPILAA